MFPMNPAAMQAGQTGNPLMQPLGGQIQQAQGPRIDPTQIPREAWAQMPQVRDSSAMINMLMGNVANAGPMETRTELLGNVAQSLAGNIQQGMQQGAQGRQDAAMGSRVQEIIQGIRSGEIDLMDAYGEIAAMSNGGGSAGQAMLPLIGQMIGRQGQGQSAPTQRTRNLPGRRQVQEEWNGREWVPQGEATNRDQARAPAAGPDIYGRAVQARTAFRPILSAARDDASSYGRLLEAAAQDSAIGDHSLIFQYMKINDPTSTVREGEFATVEQAPNWPETLRGMYNRAIDGTRMTESSRIDIIATAAALFDSNQRQFEQEYNDWLGIAERGRFNPADANIRNPYAGLADQTNNIIRQQAERSTDPLTDTAMRQMQRRGIDVGTIGLPEGAVPIGATPIQPQGQQRLQAPQGVTITLSDPAQASALAPGTPYTLPGDPTVRIAQ